jgi:hypothetical protein
MESLMRLSIFLLIAILFFLTSNAVSYDFYSALSQDSACYSDNPLMLFISLSLPYNSICGNSIELINDYNSFCSSNSKFRICSSDAKNIIPNKPISASVKNIFKVMLAKAGNAGNNPERRDLVLIRYVNGFYLGGAVLVNTSVEKYLTDRRSEKDQSENEPENLSNNNKYNLLIRQIYLAIPINKKRSHRQII